MCSGIVSKSLDAPWFSILDENSHKQKTKTKLLFIKVFYIHFTIYGLTKMNISANQLIHELVNIW